MTGEAAELNKADEYDIYDALYEFVRSVPPGKVVTYGQAAGMCEGVSLTARQAGAAMAIAPQGVPWHRVVGAGGRLPIARRGPEFMARQRELLGREGVLFVGSSADRVDMERFQWRPDVDGAAPNDVAL